jgi:hypothetical protein
MAINYTPLTSTTQGTAALAISDLVAKLTTAITANPAWTVEANLGPIGSGNWYYVIFKNDGTLSGLGSDYRFTITYNANNMYSTVSEGFSTAGIPQCKVVSLSSGSATGGTFTVTVNGQTTPAQAYNVTPATLQTAIQALSTVGAGNAIVTFGATGASSISSPGGYDIMFLHGMSGYTNPTVTATSSLTGTSPVLAVTNQTNVWLSGFNNIANPGWVDSAGKFSDMIFSPDVGSGTWVMRGVAAAQSPVVLPTSPGALNGLFLSSATATTYYYIVIVYSDHLVFGFGTTASNVALYYFGGTTPLVPASDPLAVGSFSLNGPGTTTGYASGGFTRALAPFFNQATATWVASARASGTPPLRSEDFEYFPASFIYANRDTPQSQSTGKYYVSRVFIPQALTTNVTTTYTAGEPRAIYNNLVGSNCRSTGIVLGDTIALNGTQWMCVFTSANLNNIYVDTGVAAP